MSNDTTDIAQDYIQLLKGALSHTLYHPVDLGHHRGRNVLTRALFSALKKRDILTIRTHGDAERMREEGGDWPIFAQTMVGRARLDNLHACIEQVLSEDVPGDIIETGVWRGGSSMLARGVLRAHGVTDRTVFVADSFAGLPAPDADAHPADAGATWHEADELAISLGTVRANFDRYGLLDEQVRFLEGWFKDTLPGLRDRTWSIVRLDGDMYGSTMDGLVNLYDGLSTGGFLIIDDYGIPACRSAIDDFRRDRGITDEIVQIDWVGAYWRKSG